MAFLRSKLLPLAETLPDSTQEGEEEDGFPSVLSVVWLYRQDILVVADLAIVLVEELLLVLLELRSYFLLGL